MHLQHASRCLPRRAKQTARSRAEILPGMITISANDRNRINYGYWPVATRCTTRQVKEALFSTLTGFGVFETGEARVSESVIFLPPLESADVGIRRRGGPERGSIFCGRLGSSLGCIRGCQISFSCFSKREASREKIALVLEGTARESSMVLCEIWMQNTWDRRFRR